MHVMTLRQRQIFFMAMNRLEAINIVDLLGQRPKNVRDLSAVSALWLWDQHSAGRLNRVGTARTLYVYLNILLLVLFNNTLSADRTYRDFMAEWEETFA